MSSEKTSIQNKKIIPGSIKYKNNSSEKCIICNTTARFLNNTETNSSYVECSIQLCNSCYIACYNTSTADTFQDYLSE